MQKIQKEIFRIVSDVFGEKLENVTGDMTWESQNIDSFALVELIVAIQDHFKIHFESSELNELSSVQDLVDVVQGKLNT